MATPMASHMLDFSEAHPKVRIYPYKHGTVPSIKGARLEPGNKSLYIPGVGFTAEILPSLSGRASGERKPDTFHPRPLPGSRVFTWVAHGADSVRYICHLGNPKSYASP